MKDWHYITIRMSQEVSDKVYATILNYVQGLLEPLESIDYCEWGNEGALLDIGPEDGDKIEEYLKRVLPSKRSA